MTAIAAVLRGFVCVRMKKLLDEVLKRENNKLLISIVPRGERVWRADLLFTSLLSSQR